MPPTLIFIRHGETDWNVEGRLQGQRDIPLNDKGRGQAHRNGKVLIAAIPDIAGYDFVASPLERSRETMEIARLAMGLDPSAYHLDERLREISFGEWEGFTTKELRARVPALVKARETDKWGFLPPDGESYRLLSKRIDGWLADIARPAVAVSHGGVGRVLLRHILGLDPHEAVTMSFPQDQVLLLENGVASWI
jgi:broad specificity phosphatase PhoE